jgi:transposase
VPLRACSAIACASDVITRIVSGHPNSQLDDLLPWAHPTAEAFKYGA